MCDSVTMETGKRQTSNYINFGEKLLKINVVYKKYTFQI